MDSVSLNRRGFLGASVASAALMTGTSQARAQDNPSDTDAFVYEFQQTEEAWRAQLSDIEYYVLRDFGTEAPRSSDVWDNTEVGTYACRGCDLVVYDSLQKIELERGWTFFRHSRVDTVLLGIDLNGGAMGDPFASMQALMEAHCRRCGSHLGHIVALPEVRGRPIHCINGFALKFEPAAA